MSEKILIRKTYSVYASEMHFSTMIFPFVNKEIREGAIIKTVLEKSISKNVCKILNNVNLNSDLKNKINKLDWEQTNIEKIKNILKDIEALTMNDKKIHIIVSGRNEFIEKINELIDIWIKVKFSYFENNNMLINVINCYSLEENKDIKEIKNKHDYILSTVGIEEIENIENFKKAN